VNTGGPHASSAALHAAGDKARGATLSSRSSRARITGRHALHGRVRAAGVRRVVAAGAGSRRRERAAASKSLKRAGIEKTGAAYARRKPRAATPPSSLPASNRSPFVAAEAGDVDRRPHRGCGGALAVDLGPRSPRPRPLAARPVFDAIAVAHDGPHDNPAAHGARRVEAAQAARADRVRSAAMLNSGVSLVQTAREVPTWVSRRPKLRGERVRC